MKDPSRVRVDGRLAAHADGFRVELTQRGYSRWTVVQYLQLMGHLSRWLVARGLDDRAVTPERVGAYLAEHRAAGYASRRSRRGLAPLLEYLRQCDGVPEPTPVTQDPTGRLLLRYARFLATERGLMQSTIRRNVDLVRPFLTDRVQTDGELGGLTATKSVR